MYFSKYGKIYRISRPEKDRPEKSRRVRTADVCFVHYESASQSTKAAYEAGEEISGSIMRRHYIGKYSVDVDVNPKYKADKQTQVYIANKILPVHASLVSGERKKM